MTARCQHGWRWFRCDHCTLGINPWLSMEDKPMAPLERLRPDPPHWSDPHRRGVHAHDANV